VDAHPFFTAVPPRDLTNIERDVVQRLLKSAAPNRLAEASSLSVVGRCGCGACPTVFFRAPNGRREHDLAHFTGRDSLGVTGVVLLQTEEGLSQLEFYSVDGHDPWDVPEVQSLVPFASA
jgi:hypothetical protein